jgi:hypothetical protein
MTPTATETTNATTFAHLTREHVTVFREAMSRHLQTCRQNGNRFEYYLGKIGKIDHPVIAANTADANTLLGIMRSDLTALENQWNEFNPLLEQSP